METAQLAKIEEEIPMTFIARRAPKPFPRRPPSAQFVGSQVIQWRNASF
jgi:hypothetical protein